MHASFAAVMQGEAPRNVMRFLHARREQLFVAAVGKRLVVLEFKPRSRRLDLVGFAPLREPVLALAALPSARALATASPSQSVTLWGFQPEDAQQCLRLLGADACARHALSVALLPAGGEAGEAVAVCRHCLELLPHLLPPVGQPSEMVLAQCHAQRARASWEVLLSLE
jgi:hypothetical protein